MTAMRDLLDLASDAALAIDKGLQVVAWNCPAQELLGYLPREVIGRQCHEVLQTVLPGGEPLCTAACEGALCFGRCHPFAVLSCLVRHRNGQWVPVSISTLVMPRGSLTPHPGAPVAILFLRAQEAVRSEPPIEWPLRIFTLGRFGLVAGERGIATENWERKQALTLLKYLITNLGRAVHRERLIECLWPNIDESRGRNRLKVAVYYVRQQLRAANVNESVVATVGTAYVLRREAVWLDSDAFESLVAQGAGLERQQQRDDALRCYEDAQHLYRGDYLEEEPYADWCAEERERLREVYLETLARIARGYAARGHHAKAAQVCRTALVRDPCRESFHRSLMTHLVQLGHRDQAMAQFHHCQRVLADELGVDPMPETQRLYQNILEDREAAAGVTVRRVSE